MDAKNIIYTTKLSEETQKIKRKMEEKRKLTILKNKIKNKKKKYSTNIRIILLKMLIVNGTLTNKKTKNKLLNYYKEIGQNGIKNVIRPNHVM